LQSFLKRYLHRRNSVSTSDRSGREHQQYRRAAQSVDAAIFGEQFLACSEHPAPFLEPFVFVPFEIVDQLIVFPGGPTAFGADRTSSASMAASSASNELVACSDASSPPLFRRKQDRPWHRRFPGCNRHEVML